MPPSHAVTFFSPLPGLLCIPLGAAFGIKSHLGESETAAANPNSTEGALITQLINPTDVIVNARFFLIWIYVTEIGFGLCWKCLSFFFFFHQALRDSVFPVLPLCPGDTSLVFQKALPTAATTDGISALSACLTVWHRAGLCVMG